jgi:hypothetical protein
MAWCPQCQTLRLLCAGFTGTTRRNLQQHTPWLCRGDHSRSPGTHVAVAAAVELAAKGFVPTGRALSAQHAPGVMSTVKPFSLGEISPSVALLRAFRCICGASRADSAPGCVARPLTACPSDDRFVYCAAKSKYDQSTYFGRVRHFVEAVNPM